jgi:hypothetical protein
LCLTGREAGPVAGMGGRRLTNRGRLLNDNCLWRGAIYIPVMATCGVSGILSRAIQSMRSTTSPAVDAWHRASRLRLGLLLGLILCLSLRAAEEDEKFLFLTLRYKDGAITLVKSAVVSGTLKPQRNSARPDALQIHLEKTEGESAWSLVMDDPSVRRYEYEDPDQPGVIRSKEVRVNDTEFIIRAPLLPGVRHLAVYRQEPPAPGAKAPATPSKKLLVRHTLPQGVTR